MRAWCLVLVVGCGRVGFGATDTPGDGRVAGDSAAGDPDGTPGSGGDAAAAVCGNSLVEASEQCDDGMPTAACSGSCMLVLQGPGGSGCTDPYALSLARIANGRLGAKGSGDLTGENDMVNTACGGPADQVFTVTPAIPFQLSWGVIPGDPATDVVAGLRLQLNGCGAEGGSCINAFGAGQAENGIGLGTQPAGTLVVLVAEGNTGPYTLWVEVAPQ